MIDIEDIFDWLDVAGVYCKNSDEQKELGRSLLNEEFLELMTGLKEGNKKEILDGSVDLIWIICNNLRFHGIGFQEFKDYFDKVSNSNWSKFCKTREEAVATMKAYKNGTHPDKPGEVVNCYYIYIREDLWVVFREDGKVLKNINYDKL